MIGLTPAEVQAVRADFDNLTLTETATLRRQPTPGAPWENVAGAVGVACRYSPSQGRDVDAWSDIAARVQADATLRLPADVDVRRGDRAHVTGEAGTVLCEVLWVAPSVRIHRNALVRTVESA